MRQCGTMAGRFTAKPTLLAIAATKLSSRALHACCRKARFGSAAISAARATRPKRSGRTATSARLIPCRRFWPSRSLLNRTSASGKASTAPASPPIDPYLPQAIGMPLPTSARVAAKVLPMFVRASARPWTACLTSFRAAISLQLRTVMVRAALAIALKLDPEAVLAFAVENCSLTRPRRSHDHRRPERLGWRIVTENHNHGLAFALSPDGESVKVYGTR